MPGVEIEEDLADKFRRRVAAKGLESKVCMCVCMNSVFERFSFFLSNYSGNLVYFSCSHRRSSDSSSLVTSPFAVGILVLDSWNAVFSGVCVLSFGRRAGGKRLLVSTGRYGQG